jgi:hypothetical protein
MEFFGCVVYTLQNELTFGVNKIGHFHLTEVIPTEDKIGQYPTSGIDCFLANEMVIIIIYQSHFVFFFVNSIVFLSLENNLKKLLCGTKLGQNV